MYITSTNGIIALLTNYRYALLFPLVVVEGPLVTMVAGFLCSVSIMHFTTALAVVVVADIFADTLYYALGRWGGKRMVNRWGHILKITPEHVEKLEHQYRKRGAKLLIIGKISHGLGGAFLVAAGLAEMPFWYFMEITAIATLPKSLIFLSVGYYYGHAFNRVQSVLDHVTVALAGLCIIAGLFYFLFYFQKKEESGELDI